MMPAERQPTPLPGFSLDGRPACCRPVPEIEVDRLTVSYGTKAAIRDVSLTLYKGCITALVGPSGCGKTSLLMTMNRLIDMVPGARVEGRVYLGEGDVLAPETDVVALRRRVGMIFQKPTPFPFSIRKNLALPLRQRGRRRRRQIDELIERALRDVGLWDEVADRLTSSALALSGGQQQRLCLARALILEPEVLLLDEPCSALDPLASARVEDLIAGLRGRYTIVLVTHNLAQARRLADFAAFFWVAEGAGRLIEAGPARQVLADPRQELTRAYVAGERG